MESEKERGEKARRARVRGDDDDGRISHYEAGKRGEKWREGLCKAV